MTDKEQIIELEKYIEHLKFENEILRDALYNVKYVDEFNKQSERTGFYEKNKGERFS